MLVGAYSLCMFSNEHFCDPSERMTCHSNHKWIWASHWWLNEFVDVFSNGSDLWTPDHIYHRRALVQYVASHAFFFHWQYGSACGRRYTVGWEKVPSAHLTVQAVHQLPIWKPTEDFSFICLHCKIGVVVNHTWLWNTLKLTMYVNWIERKCF